MRSAFLGGHSVWRRLSLIVVLLVGVLVFVFDQTPTAQASGGGCRSCWNITANGYTGYLNYDFQAAPTTSDGSSLSDSYAGSVFGDPMMGYKVKQADGSFKISFVRVGVRSSGFADYFQVYSGIESANGVSMSGTFREYRGSAFFVYSYSEDSQMYSWTASLISAYPLLTDSAADKLPTWSISANGWADYLRTWNPGLQILNYGQVYRNGAVGVWPGLMTTGCPNGCSMYFIRATSTDLSTLQVYQGTYTTNTSPPAESPQYALYGATASGTFIEIAQGHSGSTTYSWNATYLGDKALA